MFLENTIDTVYLCIISPSSGSLEPGVQRGGVLGGSSSRLYTVIFSCPHVAEGGKQALS